jgi:hypothetical protein
MRGGESTVTDRKALLFGVNTDWRAGTPNVGRSVVAFAVGIVLSGPQRGWSESPTDSPVLHPPPSAR